ncbi:hypothetical protein BSK53_02875 [Paenibacillus odorifer]|nr:hypothetical protein BSK53_02875 [Paenibacillus odorifer]
MMGSVMKLFPQTLHVDLDNQGNRILKSKEKITTQMLSKRMENVVNRYNINLLRQSNNGLIRLVFIIAISSEYTVK